MNDTLVLRAVYGLCLLVFTALVGIIALSGWERPVPDVLEQAVTAGIVAIAGLLPGALNRKVEIQQPANNPVPTTDVPAEPDPIPSRPVKTVRKRKP